ncbi:unnamed protein product [Bursaphelenchus okinawaensis]|uniref:NAD-dependent protein deacetylase sir-2.1 n=1 Tax=Bursaphelenchus okinawaensis TaxID=465554 RepID=A0A811KTI7_9BILA|nr:unnamed protein product [Bursaphelenchus okinawaensis]CAG9112120.1 unnamed protein product [Bursaphelenchus okinawaensis]
MNSSSNKEDQEGVSIPECSLIKEDKEKDVGSIKQMIDMSGEPAFAWRRSYGPNAKFINEMMARGLSPYQILQSLAPEGCTVPTDLPASVLFRLLFELLDEKMFRSRLPQYHDFSQAVQLFKDAKKIMIITGAGVSVSCGIPDFRSSTGIYATLKQTFPDLPRPTSMFDIEYFRRRPEPFFSFAKEIFPGMYQPSISHMFIRFLEQGHKLLRNYTQNIDTLERVAGINNVIECHGSFATATCLNCKEKYVSDDIKDDVYAQRVARCKKCNEGVIKPDIVFFGEDLPEIFHNQMGEDIDQVDLVVVIGSSLRVQPVSQIPHHVKEDVPQILINREDIRTYDADIKLLGDCDEIIMALATAMGGRIRETMINELRSREAFVERVPELQSLIDQEKTTGTQIALKVLPSEEFLQEFRKDGGASTENSKKEGCATEEEDTINGVQCASNVSDTHDEDEVPAKRQRLGTEPSSSQCNLASSPNTNDIEKLNGDEIVDQIQKAQKQMAQFWETKFISVASKLEGFMYAKFPPNLNIFKGADYYLNLDEGTLGPLPRRNDHEGFEEEESTAPPSTVSTPASSPRPCSLPTAEIENEFRYSFDERTTQSLPEYYDESDDGSP